MVQCGKHLLHVVNDILDASRLEAGRVELQESVVTLSEVMHAVQQAVGSLALAQGLQLQLPSLNPTMTMWGDSLRLTQILINLIGNAIKFSHPGGRVMVRVLTTPKGVRWEVQDEGIGIAKEDQERILQSFRQVEGETLAAMVAVVWDLRSRASSPSYTTVGSGSSRSSAGAVRSW